MEGIKNYLAPRAALENVCSFVPCSCYSLLFISHHTVQFTNLEHTLRLVTAALGWIYMMCVFLLRCSRSIDNFYQCPLCTSLALCDDDSDDPHHDDDNHDDYAS